jgi:hypothetical protein
MHIITAPREGCIQKMQVTDYYGVRLCLWTAATGGHIGHLPDDKNVEWWWNDILTEENQRTRRKMCPSATLSTINPTWIDPEIRRDMPATNRLSHGTAQKIQYSGCCDSELLEYNFSLSTQMAA